MYPYHSDAYPQKGTLLDIIQNFLSGKKATIESIKDPYGISDMDDPVIPSFVTKDTPVPPANFPQRFDNTLAGALQISMGVLGNQIEAPEEDTNIASMYAAQSAMGRVNQDKIQDYFADTNLPGNVKLKDGSTALQAWAKENPMLAQREYLKAQAKFAENAPMAPDGETVMGDLGSRAQMENPMGQEAYDAIMAAKEKLMKKAGSK